MSGEKVVDNFVGNFVAISDLTRLLSCNDVVTRLDVSGNPFDADDLERLADCIEWHNGVLLDVGWRYRQTEDDASSSGDVDSAALEHVPRQMRRLVHALMRNRRRRWPHGRAALLELCLVFHRTLPPYVLLAVVDQLGARVRLRFCCATTDD